MTFSADKDLQYGIYLSRLPILVLIIIVLMFYEKSSDNLNNKSSSQG
jgi:uncharacterized membrane protein YbaN (DUF454 family)